MPPQKLILVGVTTEDDLKTPALSDSDDPMRPVQTYKAYHCVEQGRYKEGQSPIPPTFKMTIFDEWPESHLERGRYKRANGEK